MLKYTTIKVLYWFLCIICLVTAYFYGVAWCWLALILTVLYIAIIIYGSFNVSAQFFVRFYNKGAKTKRHIALTFDDGPYPETIGVLDILKEYNVKATFFVIGKRVQEYPEIVKRMVDEGHVIGNHTYNHAKGTGFYSVQKLEQELTSTIGEVFKATALKMNFYRPPFGVTSPSTAKVVAKLGLKVIGWSLRSFDTTLKTAQSIINDVMKAVKSGDVILFHDDRIKVQEILKHIIPALQQQKYLFVTVDELFKLEAYSYDK